MGTLAELLSKLSLDNHIKGSQFEHICKWYLENNPKYRLELEKVWLWKDWPERWGSDCGIDLVARSYDGRIWAIQAKAYDTQYHIKKSDIDTFLSESSRSIFSFRLLIASTDLIGHTGQTTIEAQEKKVGLIMLSDLMKSEVDWPQSPEHLFAKPSIRKTPRPHQTKAIEDVLKGFSSRNRGQLIMACGTGKTLASLWIAEKLDCRRTLVLLPSLSLLAQTLKEWTENASREFRYLPVCSDDTVRGEDHFTSHTSEIGLPVTTDPDVVAEFLCSNNNLVIFSTYQSSPVIADAFARHDISAFDLSIADEAHRCTGPVSSDFATILNETAILSKRRLFMTATPRYFTDQACQEADELEYEIASMDDDEIFGTIFHCLSFSEAIKQSLLCDYQIAIIGVDNLTFKKYAEHEVAVTYNGKVTTDAKTLASQIALCKTMRKYDLKRIISFHGRIKKAESYSEQFPNVVKLMPAEIKPDGKIWSSYVCGEMSSGQRNLRINRLRFIEKDERGLISNARCLGEGVDVPALDGVAFVDPRYSQIEIIQAVGRAIRKAPDKKRGVIILSVFVDNSENPELVLESSAFEPIWKVLKALRAHDDILAAELDRLRGQLGTKGAFVKNMPEKIIIDLPVSVGEKFALDFKTKIVEKTSSSWQVGYYYIKQYTEEKGNSLVPGTYITKEGFNLGQWIGWQRAQYKKGTLSNERIKLLEQLAGWVWDVPEKNWNEAYSCLCQYAYKHGHSSVPLQYSTDDGFNLGGWVNFQRGLYKKGLLSNKRKIALESLPGWELGRNEQRWLTGYLYMEEYVQQYGHSFVLPNYSTDDGFNLADWVSNQRIYYRQGVLSLTKQKDLEKLPGWVWVVNDAKWELAFCLLKKYSEHNIISNIPLNYTTDDGFNLGGWVITQCKKYQDGTLLIERQRMLEQLPGWIWDLCEKIWQEGYTRLKQYVKKHGTALVLSYCETDDGFKLGQWIVEQQNEYKNGSLSQERQNVLEALPGWLWDLSEEFWLVGYARFKRCVELYGMAVALCSGETVDGLCLKEWAIALQNQYKNSRLSQEKQKALEALPGWVWESHEDWMSGYTRLKNYGMTYISSSFVTDDSFRLGKWIMAQYKEYQNSTLPLERQRLLEQLPGWVWDLREEDWLTGYSTLKKYVDIYGMALATCMCETDNGLNLRQWVAARQSLYKNGTLSRERQKALEALPGWVWETHEDWMSGYERFKRYIEKNGTVRILRSFVTADGYKLGQWVGKQRHLYKKGSLPKERKLLLEQLPSWSVSTKKR